MLFNLAFVLSSLTQMIPYCARSFHDMPENEIRAAIESLTQSTEVSVTRYVVISDEGTQSKSPPRFRFQMSKGLSSKTTLQNKGDVSLYQAVGSPQVMAEILKSIGVASGPRKSGIQFLGTKKP